jgi:hypothetical protein
MRVLTANAVVDAIISFQRIARRASGGPAAFGVQLKYRKEPAMPTAMIDHRYTSGALAHFTVTLKVDYSTIGKCRLDEGSIILRPDFTVHNPLWELEQDGEVCGPIHDSPKKGCTSSKPTENQQDRVKCEYFGRAALRTPPLQIPGTEFGIPGLVLKRMRFKVILWIHADGSTKKRVDQDGQKIA